MKAWQYERFGPVQEVLHLKEIQNPVLKSNEVLVRITHTALNDYDWSMVRGKPWIYGFLFGWRKPKYSIPGMELSGIVEKVGSEVSAIKVGDYVYGDISNVGFGTFATHINVPAQEVQKLPEGITLSQAAAIPHASMLAYQALFENDFVKSGQKILINGAGGGVGTYSIQLLKQYSVEVTGVDTGDKLVMMDQLGYDHIIDYKITDFTDNGIQYDLILDTKTNRSPFKYLRSLTNQGRYVTVGGTPGRLIQLVGTKVLMPLFSNKSIHIIALKPNKYLSEFHQMMKMGEFHPVIDGPHSFAKLPELLQYFGEGRHQGKVVIEVP